MTAAALCSAPILLFALAAASAWFPPRIVGSFDAPAEADETLLAMGRAVSALTAAVCAAVVVLAAAVFAWVCRPGRARS